MKALQTKDKSLRIGLACGGTGGHIFPGLATAEALRARGHDVTLWMAGKDIESSALQGWQGTVQTVASEGFQSRRIWRVLVTAWGLRRACRRAVAIMRDQPPDAVLAMGSYASVGPVWAALKLRIPVVLHEANVTPGRAVSLFARRAARVAACFEESRHYLRKTSISVTGFPLRPGLETAARDFDYQPLKAGRLHILSTGGSRGSTPLNRIVSQAVVDLYRFEHNLFITHLTGSSDESDVRGLYKAKGIPARVFRFVHDMAELYQEADLAICRAGAATCAELSAFGLPALLVPYPFAVRDHQTENARAMERVGAADFVQQRDLEAEWLAEYLEGCKNTPSRLERISRAARARGRRDAAERLADEVIGAAIDHQSANA